MTQVLYASPLLRVDVEGRSGEGVILRWKGVKIPLVQRIQLEAVADGEVKILFEWLPESLLNRLLLSGDPAITEAIGTMQRIRGELEAFLGEDPPVNDIPRPTVWDRLRDDPE